MTRQSPGRKAKGQVFMYYLWNPRSINLVPGYPAGGLVTGAGHRTRFYVLMFHVLLLVPNFPWTLSFFSCFFFKVSAEKKQGKILPSKDTPARKDYIHNFLFSELFFQKLTCQLQENIYQLHITYSFVIERITWINCLGIISWKISFQLHEIMFSELVS